MEIGEWNEWGTMQLTETVERDTCCACQKGGSPADLGHGNARPRREAQMPGPCKTRRPGASARRLRPQPPPTREICRRLERGAFQPAA